MADLPESVLYEGVCIDISFKPLRPTFGDLFLICGAKHPLFPPSASFAFDLLTDLQFDQVDDYFGIRSFEDEGTDVTVWLYPLVKGEPVHHHPGPFDAVRLEYSVLRNPARRVDQFLKCVEQFGKFGAGTRYRNREIDLGSPPDLSGVSSDIDKAVRHWAMEGIKVGSSDALKLDF